MICPIVEAEASTAPAKWAGKPALFIRGMVIVPVVVVLATELPDIEPIIVLATTAALAGPPVVPFVIAKAISVRNFPPPDFCNIAPYKINKKIKLAETPKGMPNMPSVDRARYVHSLSILIGVWQNIAGSCGPRSE
jgi:hypothetical protein